MTNQVLEVLKKRRSLKAYNDIPVTKEELDCVLEAGLFAPNGMGKQCTILVAVTDKTTRDILSRLNARVMGKEGFDPFYNAATVVAVLADTNCNTWQEDGSLVIGNMLNAAFSLGLGACWIHRAREVFDSKEGMDLKTKWQVPSSYRGVGFCVLGHGDIPCEIVPRLPGRIIYIDK